MHSASVCVMRRVASRVGSAVGPGRGAPSVRPLSAIAGGVGDLPKCAQKGPYKVTLKAGKMVPWCSCGLSNKQPRCDGSHRKHETGMEPLRYKVRCTAISFAVGGVAPVLTRSACWRG